jgi:hypothetical protein
VVNKSSGRFLQFVLMVWVNYAWDYGKALRPFNCAQLIEMVESLPKYEGFFYRVTLRQAQCDK